MDDLASRIDGFWRWWGDLGRRSVGAALTAPSRSAGADDGIAAVLAPAVRAVHPDLDWEVGDGVATSHRLTIGAGRRREMVATARRWLAGAPVGDETWSYGDLRLPRPVHDVFRHGQVEVDTRRASAAVRPQGSGALVTVWHPDLVRLAAPVRRETAWLLVEGAVGEELARLWVDDVTVARGEGGEGLEPLHRLPALVSPIARAGSAEGEVAWTVHETDREGPRVVARRVRHHPLMAPTCELDVAVTVAFSSRQDGMPSSDVLAALQAFEDHVLAAIAPDALLIGVVTGAGSQVLRLRLDPEGGAPERLASAVQGWQHGAVRIDTSRDPAWTVAVEVG